jgi:hypothetical protein
MQVPGCRTVQQEQLLYRNEQWFPGGLVFKAHRLVYHSTLGLGVMKKKNKFREARSDLWSDHTAVDGQQGCGGPDVWVAVYRGTSLIREQRPPRTLQ